MGCQGLGEPTWGVFTARALTPCGSPTDSALWFPAAPLPAEQRGSMIRKSLWATLFLGAAWAWASRHLPFSGLGPSPGAPVRAAPDREGVKTDPVEPFHPALPSGLPHSLPPQFRTKKRSPADRPLAYHAQGCPGPLSLFSLCCLALSLGEFLASSVCVFIKLLAGSPSPICLFVSTFPFFSLCLPHSLLTSAFLLSLPLPVPSAYLPFSLLFNVSLPDFLFLFMISLLSLCVCLSFSVSELSVSPLVSCLYLLLFCLSLSLSPCLRLTHCLDLSVTIAGPLPAGLSASLSLLLPL